MIANITAGSDFSGLKDYLTANRDHEVIEPVGVSLDYFVKQMEVVAAQSSRAQKPVKHVSFSAAREDGQLSPEKWLTLIDGAEQELGLTGHCRIVVRHADKDYDHVHVFWCTVSAATGRTPPKRWFREQHAPLPEVGPRALSEPQVALLSTSDRKLKSYDAHALTRLQHLCRAFERQHGLQQLNTPAQAAEARKAGKARSLGGRQKHRAERSGDSLLDKSRAIRTALDATNWNERARNLAALGCGIRPKIIKQKDGSERQRGILIYDLTNEENCIAASTFDTGTVKYGWSALDKRTAPDEPNFAAWWSEVGENSPMDSTASPNDPLRERYEETRERHRAREEEKSLLRAQLAAQHKEERTKLRAELMQARRKIADQLPSYKRRDFYAGFHAGIRRRSLNNLKARQTAEREQLRPTRMRSFATFRRDTLVLVSRLFSAARNDEHDEYPTGGTQLSQLRSLADLPALKDAPALRTSVNVELGVRFLNDQADGFERAPPTESPAANVPPGMPLVRESALGSLPRGELVSPDRSLITAELKYDQLAPDEPLTIDGFMPKRVGEDVHYSRPGRASAFVDNGRIIEAFTKDEDALRAALKLALLRSRGQVSVDAPPKLAARIQDIAVSLGEEGRLTFRQLPVVGPAAAPTNNRQTHRDADVRAAVFDERGRPQNRPQGPLLDQAKALAARSQVEEPRGKAQQSQGRGGLLKPAEALAARTQAEEPRKQQTQEGSKRSLLEQAEALAAQRQAGQPQSLLKGPTNGPAPSHPTKGRGQER